MSLVKELDWQCCKSEVADRFHHLALAKFKVIMMNKGVVCLILTFQKAAIL